MKILHPLMGCRRRKQIEEALTNYDSTLYKRTRHRPSKLTDTDLKWLQDNKHLSLRARARALNVCHETVRRRLKSLEMCSMVP